MSGPADPADSGRPDAFRRWLGATSLHGAGRLLPETSRWRLQRLVWLLLTVFCLIMVNVQISSRIKHFYSNPVAVDIESTSRRRLTFPAVTICNQNWLRLSALANTSTYHFWRSYWDPRQNFTDADVNSTFGALTEGDLEYYVAFWAHRRRHLIFSCSWGGKHNNCDHRHFTRTFTDYGQCYTFNADERAPLESRRSGIKFGLRLVLNVEQYEYVLGPEMTAGVKVLAHHQRQPALLQNAGFYVPVGFKADAALQLRTWSRLGPPHGRCGERPLQFYRRYSRAACEKDCVNEYMLEQCQCRDVFVPQTAPGTPPLCSLRVWLLCALHVTDRYHAADRQCRCPEACRSERIHASVTYSKLSYRNTPNVVAGQMDKYQAARRRFLHSLNTNERLAPERVKRSQKLTKCITSALVGFQSALDACFSRVQATVKRFNAVFDSLWYQLDVLVQVTRILKSAYESYIVAESVEPCQRLVDAGSAALVTLGQYEVPSVAAGLAALPVTARPAAAASARARLAFAQGTAHQMAACLAEAHNRSTSLYPAKYTVLRRLPQYAAVMGRITERHTAAAGALTAVRAALSALETALDGKPARLPPLGRQLAAAAKKAATEAGRLTSLLRKKYLVSAVQSKLEREMDARGSELASRLQEFSHTTDLTETLNTTQRDAGRLAGLLRLHLSAFQAGRVTKLQLSEFFASSRMSDAVSALRNTRTGLLTKTATLPLTRKSVDTSLDQLLATTRTNSFSRSILENATNISLRRLYSFNVTVTQTLERRTQRSLAQLSAALRVLLDALQLAQTDAGEFLHQTSSSRQFIQENFLELNVFFSSFDEQRVGQRQAYTYTSLLADIGGSMGLFVGASLLTCVEMAEFAVLYLLQLCRAGWRRCRASGRRQRAGRVTPDRPRVMKTVITDVWMTGPPQQHR